MQDIADFQMYYEKEQKVYAQMTLGYRYNMGVGGVDLKCRSSVMYYEPAAYLTT
jgi:TPR repeat protein